MPTIARAHQLHAHSNAGALLPDPERIDPDRIWPELGVTIRRMLLIVGEGPLKELISAHCEQHDVKVDLAPDGIGAVKRLWEQRYDAILAEPARARVGGHRLGDVVAEIAPGTPVVVLKPTQQLPSAEQGESVGSIQERARALLGEILLALGVAARRKSAPRPPRRS